MNNPRLNHTMANYEGEKVLTANVEAIPQIAKVSNHA